MRRTPPLRQGRQNRANPPVKRHQEHAAPISRGNSRQPQRNAGMPEPFYGFHPPAPASRRKGKQDGEGPAVHQHAVECEHEAAGRPRQRLLRHQTGSVRQRPQETQHESPCQPEQGEILARTAGKQKKTAAVRFIMIREIPCGRSVPPGRKTADQGHPSQEQDKRKPCLPCGRVQPKSGAEHPACFQQGAKQHPGAYSAQRGRPASQRGEQQIRKGSRS